MCATSSRVTSRGFAIGSFALTMEGRSITADVLINAAGPHVGEIATMIGLMVQATIDATLPAPERFQEYVDRAQALLPELPDQAAQPGLVPRAEAL